MVLLEVLVVYDKKNDAVVQLVKAFEKQYRQQTVRHSDVVYVSTRKNVKQMQPNQIRESLEKGYVEMSQLNLSICYECLHAEYEAEEHNIWWSVS